MARQLGSLILAGFAGFAGVRAEDSPPVAKPPDAPAASTPRRPPNPEFGNARRALEALTPEQRQHFIENLKRWTSLPPEEKKALADREGMHRSKIAQEIDRAIGDAGLTLDGERRALFARRYFEERRKVEEQLRKEMEQKRQPMLDDLTARLKAEFSTSATAPH